MNKLSVFAGALALGASLFSFNANANETVTVGATPVPHAEILEFVKPILAKDGYDLKIVEFNDYVQPNLATDDGQLDANYFQHIPYLDSFNQEHNLTLKKVAGVHIEPIALYSKSLKNYNDIKEGGLVSIPNDPTNGGRALLLLQKAGLITLNDPTSITSTTLDIKDNPKKLNFKELEAAQLPRSLDEVDLAVINTNFAIGAGLNPLKDAIFIEDKDSPYVNVLVASEKSQDKPGVKKLAEVLNSKEVSDFIIKKYEGAVIPAF